LNRRGRRTVSYKRKKIRAGLWLYRGFLLEQVGGYDGDDTYWVAARDPGVDGGGCPEWMDSNQDTLYAIQGEVDYVINREG